MKNARKPLLRLLALCLCAALCLPALGARAATSKRLTVDMTVVTYQNRARAALKQINALRAQKGLQELIMLADLESLAIQRAAELFVFFDHDRPDLTSFESAENDMVSGKTRESCAECIAAGYSSADALMEDWGANALDNLLDADFTHAGVACVYVKGSYNEYYWALYLEGQPETFAGKQAAATAKSGKSKSVSVEISSDMFARADKSHKRFELRVNNVNLKTKQLAEPTVYLYDRYDVKIGRCELDDLSFKSSNANVFTVKQSGTIRRKKVGSATLTVSFAGLDNATCTVTIGSGSSASSSSGSNATAVTADTIGDRKPNLSASQAAKHTTLSVYVKGASGYVLYRSATKTGTYTKTDEKATTSRCSFKIEHDDLTKAYYYKVRAYKNKNGKRSYSEYSTAVRVAP